MAAESQADLAAMVREILKEKYLSFSIWRYRLDEDLIRPRALVTCSLKQSDTDEVREVMGSGVGLVDALFKALKHHLVDDFPSLGHIQFVAFGISGEFTGQDRESAGSDAVGEVMLTVANDKERQFEFTHKDPSVSGSTVMVVLSAIEHFVNAERAVLFVYDWFQQAKERNRQELTDLYTAQLASLTHIATYSEAIEKKRDLTGL